MHYLKVPLQLHMQIPVPDRLTMKDMQGNRYYSGAAVYPFPCLIPPEKPYTLHYARPYLVSTVDINFPLPLGIIRLL